MKADDELEKIDRNGRDVLRVARDLIAAGREHGARQVRTTFYQINGGREPATEVRIEIKF